MSEQPYCLDNPIVLKSIKDHWSTNYNDQALLSLVRLNAVSKALVENTQEIYKKLFGSHWMLAYAIAKASLYLESNDQYKDNLKLGLQCLTTDMSESELSEYTEEFELLKEHESMLLEFLSDSPRFKYAFQLPSLFLNTTQSEPGKIKEKLNIFKSLVLLILAYTYYYHMQAMPEDEAHFKYKNLYKKYGPHMLSENKGEVLMSTSITLLPPPHMEEPPNDDSNSKSPAIATLMLMN